VTEILKIVLILLVLLLLIKKKLDLGLVLFSGALLTALLFNLGWSAFILTVGQALVASDTLRLIGIVLLVLYIGNLLQMRGHFKDLVDSLRNVIPEPRLILALPSAFIGLLPMLGGALVSAPVVEEASRRWELSGAWKTFLNYWFRHIWEYCWPLYINMILASAILQVPIMKIAFLQSPFTALAFMLGLIWMYRHVPPLAEKKRDRARLRDAWQIVVSIWPILLAILLIFTLRFDMLLSLGVVSVLTQVLYRFETRERLKLILKSVPLRTVGLIAAVMLFKRTLEVSGALDSAAGSSLSEGVSSYPLLFAVPFFLGLLTGVNHAYVGISFPLLLPVFGAENPDLILVLFAYVSGFVGILLSPAHLCLFLTLDYFQADLRDVYKILWLPCLIILLAAFLMLLFLRII
jgi:integral membrane protein (TIGR00529 family)